MGLRTQFNLLLIIVWIAGLGAFAFISTSTIERVARSDVLRTAHIMMAEASGARDYTSAEIAPLINLSGSAFRPQSVSAYAAKKSFLVLKSQFPDFAYREVALNPTNPEDRATDWEADLINDFRLSPSRAELVMTRDTPTGQFLYLAKPIIAEHACLQCHSTAEHAPQSMVRQYGAQNGFGWQEGAVIGAQIVSVPTVAAANEARDVRNAFLLPFTLVFILLFFAINVLLHVIILRPIDAITRSAEAISLGQLDTPDVVPRGSDQVSRLAQAFTRMSRSLRQALRLLNEDGQQP